MLSLIGCFFFGTVVLVAIIAGLGYIIYKLMDWGSMAPDWVQNAGMVAACIFFGVVFILGATIIGCNILHPNDSPFNTPTTTPTTAPR